MDMDSTPCPRGACDNDDVIFAQIWEQRLEDEWELSGHV